MVCLGFLTKRVGEQVLPDPEGIRGFLFNNGHFTTITVPDSLLTIATGINSLGRIVGLVIDHGGNHGFLATP
jgi:hypothetical protein